MNIKTAIIAAQKRYRTRCFKEGKNEATLDHLDEMIRLAEQTHLQEYGDADTGDNIAVWPKDVQREIGKWIQAGFGKSHALSKRAQKYWLAYSKKKFKGNPWKNT